MKKTKRNIFYGRIFKSIYVMIFLAVSGIFMRCMIGLSKYMDLNAIPFVNGNEYYETRQCGLDMIWKLEELVESSGWEKISGQNDSGLVIDVSNPQNNMEQVNVSTSYYIKDIYDMQKNESLSKLEKYLEGAKEQKSEEESAELREKFAEEMQKQGNPVQTKENYDFSDEFIYLYLNREEFETRKTIQGEYLADYVKNLYLWGTGLDPQLQGDKVSLMNLYENLVYIGKELETYKGMLNQPLKPSNMMYWIKDMDNNILCTNCGELKDYSEETARTYFQNQNYKNMFDITRKNGVVDFQKDDRKMSDAEKEIMYFVNDQLFSENEHMFIALNTQYPIKDEFYTTDHIFVKTKEIMGIMAGCVVVSLLLLGILIMVCGKVRSDNHIHTTWIENIPTEIIGLLCIGMLIAMIFIYGIVLTGYDGNFLSRLMMTGLQMLSAGVFLTAFLSIVRRSKVKKLWKSSLIYTIFKTSKKIHGTRKTARRQAIAFTVLAVVNLLLAEKMRIAGIVIAAILDSVFLLYLIRESAGRQVIFEGLAKIAGGEIDFKIDTSDLIGETKEMADAVNHVGDGLTKAVQETVKSERLKADLITNVSHDIKTPLTSIINYVDLIKRENIQDHKIKGYIRVLDQKSQRLKQLTEDLVEASKISSGNIVLDIQPIQLGELVLQTNGEFEEKFAARHLQLLCKIPDEPSVIEADGRRMWRVLENLYNNVAKYAMAGTRVYVDIEHLESRVIFSIKNISATPLNVRPEELTQRFIRGDTSRSTEGSGLGLSIASNLVKMQNGIFDVQVDGDLFKITLEFEKADTESKNKSKAENQ